MYRKSDFLCEGCIKLNCDRKRREILGIREIVSSKEYNATHKLYCDKCELYEWNYTISFKNGDKYLLCDGCVRFFYKYEEQRNGLHKRYREGTIVNLSIGYTIHNKHC